MQEIKLGDILKSINFKTNLGLINKENRDLYVPFVINRIYSNFPDTLFSAQTMNQLPYLDKDIQYTYMCLSVPKRKRYSPIKKVEKDLKYVENVCEKYRISKKAVLKYYMNMENGDNNNV